MSKDNKNTLKKFGIISSIIFSVIIIFSILWFEYAINTHTSDVNVIFVQSINVIILSAGLIGLGYCIIILRTFDSKIDKGIAENYDKLLEDLNKDKDDEKKIMCF